jgi:hypothetical protein
MTLQRGSLMLLRLLSFLCLLSLPQGVLAQHSGMPTRERVPETCPVTKPGQTSLFLPPPPYRTKAGNGRFWFGTDRLWTNLPDNGILRGLADGISSAHPTISEKLFWWRQGYDAHVEPRPRLRVTGKRIDSPAPPLEVSPTTNAFTQHIAAMLVGIGFPTNGCWQISARYDDDELTFVIWVAAPLTTAAGHY